MFCTKCGTQLRDQDRFCAQCGAAAGRQPEAAPPAKRQLARSMHDKKIAGVCSGFAHYLDMDVVLVRIAWLTVALVSGVGFVAYLIAWIAMPKENGYYGASVAQSSAIPTSAA